MGLVLDSWIHTDSDRLASHRHADIDWQADIVHSCTVLYIDRDMISWCAQYHWHATHYHTHIVIDEQRSTYELLTCARTSVRAIQTFTSSSICLSSRPSIIAYSHACMHARARWGLSAYELYRYIIHVYESLYEHDSRFWLKSAIDMPTCQHIMMSLR